MWIQSRTPSPSRRAETASSKSRAVAGSTVKVGSAVRSMRGPGSARTARRPRAPPSRAASGRSAAAAPRAAPRRRRGPGRPGRGRRSAGRRASRLGRARSSLFARILPRASGICSPRLNSGGPTRTLPLRLISSTSRSGGRCSLRAPRPSSRSDLVGDDRDPAIEVAVAVGDIVVGDAHVRLDALVEERCRRP